ncbi:MAG: hypothetical protein L0H54_08470 [Alcaligenaceae bacterium]|nr:hypothetical protein [Alcaligenaceae bacterium]
MRTLVAVIALGVLAGCSTYSTNRYASSTHNAMLLAPLKGGQVQVGEFTSSVKNKKTGGDQTEIMCRAVGPVRTPDGESFADYIRNAMVDEMKVAEVYAPSAPTVISGNLDAIDFSSGIGHWTMSLTLTSNNGKSMTMNEKYPYKISYWGQTACFLTAQAFVPAVQDLVGKAVLSAEFNGLLAQ